MKHQEKISWLPNKEIDRKLWDDCIAKSPYGLIYAYSWYLDVVCPGWEALVYEDYSAVFPLTCRKKFGIRYLYQPFFTQQLGLFTSKILKPDELNNLTISFLNHIPERYKLIEINLNLSNQVHEYDGFKITKHLTHHLPLNSAYNNISARYSENLKRNLKKASTHSFEIKNHEDPSFVINLFRENRGKEVKNMKSEHYELLTRICSVVKEKADIKIYSVNEPLEQPCSGAIFIEINNHAIFLFSGLSETGKTKAAMPFLIDYYIRENAGRDIFLDFEGSDDPGLGRFYKSFGSKEYVYLQCKKNTLPAYIRWMKK